ncbi:hypothetical protein FACS1894200_03500 [Spirochaetia bacterium]|nr:hypothetical protein FACS1894200_03500 [Spirochaetia bacterium]
MKKDKSIEEAKAALKAAREAERIGKQAEKAALKAALKTEREEEKAALKAEREKERAAKRLENEKWKKDVIEKGGVILDGMDGVERNNAIRILEAMGKQERVFLIGSTTNLVRIQHDKDGQEKAWLEPLTLEYLKNELQALMSIYMRYIGKDGEEVFTERIPLAIFKAFMALDHYVLSQALPRIKGIINHPTITKEGRVISRDGYEPELQYWINSSIEVNSDMPTAEAMDTFLDLFCDFTFEGLKNGDLPYANPDVQSLLAYALTVITRGGYDGITPSIAISAPQSRTGKSLLSEILYIALTGKPPSMTQDGKDEELEKKLIAHILAGSESILFDNVAIGRTFNSPNVASIITAGAYSGRLLGQNKTIEAKLNAIIGFTGNNLQLSTELANRSIYIKLEPRTETDKPSFKHPDIKTYAKENQALFVSCILSIAKAALTSNTKNTIYFQGFVEWENVVGKILTHYNMTDFDKIRREEAATAADEEFDNAGVFLAALANWKADDWKEGEKLGKYCWTPKEMLDIAIETGYIEDGKSAKALGKKLKGIIGVNRYEYVLTKERDNAGMNYKVSKRK